MLCAMSGQRVAGSLSSSPRRLWQRSRPGPPPPREHTLKEKQIDSVMAERLKVCRSETRAWDGLEAATELGAENVCPPRVAKRRERKLRLCDRPVKGLLSVSGHRRE